MACTHEGRFLSATLRGPGDSVVHTELCPACYATRTIIGRGKGKRRRHEFGPWQEPKARAAKRASVQKSKG